MKKGVHSTKKKGGRSTKKKVGNILVHMFLSVLAVVWVFPIFWVCMTSLRAGKGSYSTTFLPKELTFNNFTRLFTETSIFNFPRMFMNTLVVAVFSCLLSMIFLISIAYVMSRMRFPMRKPFLNVALILGMFPAFMSMIAIYYILKGIGLTEGVLKLVSLVLVYSGGANILSFYVAKGFFDTIPKGIDEAAYMEGATKWHVLTKIVMPLSRPILVYTLLQSFIAPWTDFIFAKVIIGSEAKYYTVAVGLWNMLTKENIYQWYTRFAAGAVCISIPIAALFIYVQRYYADGLSGAVKG